VPCQRQRRVQRLLRAGAWKVDGFVSLPVNTKPGVFDDDPDTQRLFWGVYAVRPMLRPPEGVRQAPGGFGTVLAQNAWLPVLRTLGTRPWCGGRLLVSRAQHVFNDPGAITDEAVRAQLRDFLRGFVQFMRAGPASQ
jgi:hypothetical protein